jgi:putative membrane protein
MLNKTNLSFLPRSLTPLQMALLTLWVLLMISFPIVDWTLGWQVMVGAVIMGVLAQVVTVVAVLWTTWGGAKTLRIAAIVVILGWAAEALGSRTGFPFGGYHYTPALQPQLLHVPVLIPLAWLMMLPPAWAVAQALTRDLAPRWQTAGFVLISALAMTAWDLFLDPQMVAWGLWQWDQPSGYFGIPWSNYLGWLLVSALITARARPGSLPVAPLLLVYTITWLLQTIGLGVFWAMPGPALVGGVVMGIFAILGWRAFLNKD